MAELISGLWTRLKESQIHVDQRRREDSIFAFQAAAVKKRFSAHWRPTNIAFMGHKYPCTVIDNWASAWKVRRHYEEVNELRRAQGKPTF